MTTVVDNGTIGLSQDELCVLASILEIDTLPTVLRVMPSHDSVRSRRDAFDSARSNLERRGLLVGQSPRSDVSHALFALKDPDALLEARSVGSRGTRRLCFLRNGFDHVTVIRESDRFTVRPVWSDGTAGAIGSTLLSFLGAAEPTTCGTVSAPVEQLAPRLDACTDPGDIAGVLQALGMTVSHAMSVGTVLGTCHTRTEVVAWSIDDAAERGDRRRLGSGALAVFDSGRGRVLAGPSRAPDGTPWTTIGPGSDHRIVQAVGLLIESLHGGGWMG